MTHIYEGDSRWRGEVRVNGVPLDPRLDLANHSPTGLSWGYHGSGPTQLALAILAHHFGWRTREDAASELVNWFRDHWAAQIPQEDTWTLTSDELRALLTLRERGAL